MSIATTFDPDWVSPPGDTIRDALVARQLTLDDFAAQIGLSRGAAVELLSGELAIDDPLADRLSEAIGASGHFWLNREARYRLRLKRREMGAAGKAQRAFLKQLPLRDMKAYGWLDAFAHLPDDEAALCFFDDDDGDWRVNGLSLVQAVAFRTSYAHETNTAAVAAWLRQGVIQADKIGCAPWNPEALRAAIPRLRALTRVKDPSVFFPKLVEMCRQCGVAIIFARTPMGCRASGAAHFAKPNKVIIQLSFRYRSDDHFWFTFFHEVAHLLLHGNSGLFIDGSNYTETDEEAEANAFAAKTLIPPECDAELAHLGRKFSVIMRFAKRLGVSPGVVVGQMQNRGLLHHDQMNFLKVRYDWHVASISP